MPASCSAALQIQHSLRDATVSEGLSIELYNALPKSSALYSSALSTSCRKLNYNRSNCIGFCISEQQIARCIISSNVKTSFVSHITVCCISGPFHYQINT